MVKEKCEACGKETASKVWVGSVYLCRLCSSSECVSVATKLARSNHREKLEKLWEELSK